MIKKIKKKMIDDNFFKGCHSLVEKMVGVGHVFHKRMRNLLLLVANPCDARDSLKRKKQYCNYHLLH